MLSLERAREILGDDAKALSDDEVLDLVRLADFLAEAAVESAEKELQEKAA